MRLRFPAGDKAKSFIKVEYRISLQDLQGERYAFVMRPCRNCLDNRRSQTIHLLLRQNLKIDEVHCIDTSLHRKNAHLLPIDDYNV